MLATAAVRPPLNGPSGGALVGVFSVGGFVPPLPARATTRAPVSGFHVNPRGLVRALATVVVRGGGVGGAVVALAVADAANASARVADAMSARRRWAVLM